MKKRLRAIIILVLALMLAAPMAVFGEEAPPGAIGGSLTVEYRYMAGQAPNIPPTIERFGFTYYLVSQSDPVLESTLPDIRTYEYRIEGALSPEDLASIVGLGDVKYTEVYVPVEREVNFEITYSMRTNDVDGIPKARVFTVTSAFTEDGEEDKSLDLTGVTFSPPTKDSLGLPTNYRATAVYRGVETHEILGYYLVEMTYESEEEDETEVYVITAQYQTDEMPPPIEIAEGPTPLDAGGAGLTQGEETLVGQQSGNPFADIANGLVPLGGVGVTNAWSYLSMLLSVAAVAIAAVYAIGFVTRKRRALITEGAEDEARTEMPDKRGNAMRIVTIIVAIITPLIWVSLEYFNSGMVWINAFTPIVAIFFGLTVVMSVITNARNKKAQSSDDDLLEAEYTVA